MTVKTYFDDLTLEESARINKAFLDKGYSFIAWEDRQQELEAVYVPLPAIKWSERTDAIPSDELTRIAYASFCATMDRLEILHYPTMSKTEGICEALMGAHIAMDKNGGFSTLKLIRPLPVAPTPELKKEVSEKLPKRTFKEKMLAFLFD